MSENKNAIQVRVGTRGLAPTTLDEMWRLATAVANSGLAPKGMDSPEKCLIAIQTGMEAGLAPMSALRSIVVINGMPSWKGDQALGLVRASGLLDEYACGYSGAADDYGAWVKTRRKGEAESKTTTFTVKDAKRAGLWAKAGPWSSYPQRMLYYRALGFHLRDNYSDVLSGMPIAEEAQDFPVEVRQVEARPVDATPDPLMSALALPEQKPEVPAESHEPDPPTDSQPWPDEAGEVADEAPKQAARHDELVALLADKQACEIEKARMRLAAYAQNLWKKPLEKGTEKQYADMAAKITGGEIVV